MAKDNVITHPVIDRLRQREARIEEAERNSYLVRGTELAAIRDEDLWKQLNEFATFEEYCHNRWELEKGYVWRLVTAATFAQKVYNCKLSVPGREAHIRPLYDRLTDRHGYTDDDRLAVWRDVIEQANGRITGRNVDEAINRYLKMREIDHITLSDWNELIRTDRTAVLGRQGKKSLNKQDNADIEWADWSWNPITGCLHACPYCYARDIAFSIYPDDVGFAPTIWPDRLTAPLNHKPADAKDIAAKNIFTCSMADLFGRWVPNEWIERVFSTVKEASHWNFLFLTKFPKRMSEFEIPQNAWMGTTVDLQARVANAEKAFEKIKAPVKWLSIEPMSEPLKFSKLEIFDWVVIGGASSSKATDGTPSTPDFNPPIDWMVDLHQQARTANCKIYYKTNSGLSDMTRIREFPGSESAAKKAPVVFDYLRNVAMAEQTG